MDVALGRRLIQTGQGDDLAQPEILLAAAERLEDLHRLFEGLDKQCRPRPFHKVLLHSQLRGGYTPDFCIAIRYLILQSDT